MTLRRLLWVLPLVLAACNLAPNAKLNSVGEKAPSEDPAILNFHRVGTFHNTTLYRSASPFRDLAKKLIVSPSSAEARATAVDRMASLRARGIRTIISFENPDSADHDKTPWINLEKSAAAAAGIHFVSAPLNNFGPNSFETMSSVQCLQTLQSVDQLLAPNATSGDILIHCSAGHDRTGIVVAYLRLRYSRWTPDQAIAEMRLFGHNWPKYSRNFGASSWHEGQLRAIAPLVQSN
jgi:protein tyrosine/serine phosphatase